jgi:hypothetical protein
MLFGRPRANPYLRRSLCSPAVSYTLCSLFVNSLPIIMIQEQDRDYGDNLLRLTAMALSDYLIFGSPLPLSRGGDGIHPLDAFSRFRVAQNVRKFMASPVWARFSEGNDCRIVMENLLSLSLVPNNGDPGATHLQMDAFVYLWKATRKMFRANADEQNRGDPANIGQRGVRGCARSGCGRRTVSICGRCQCVRYCSRRCQREDWVSYHRSRCFISRPVDSGLRIFFIPPATRTSTPLTGGMI